MQDCKWDKKIGEIYIHVINLPANPDNLNLDKRKKLINKKKPKQESKKPNRIVTKLEFPQSQKLKRPKYFFSKNHWTSEHDEALETLLEKFFPNIYKLKDIKTEDFEHGQIQVLFLPNVLQKVLLPLNVLFDTRNFVFGDLAL